MENVTEAFAVPGDDTLIDVVRPDTGCSWISGETLEEIRARYPGAEVVKIEDFCRAKAARQDAEVEWLETTEEKYEEMLNVLPPECMMGGGFLVGEPWDHHALTGRPRFSAYLKRGEKYFAASRPMQKSEFVALFV